MIIILKASKKVKNLSPYEVNEESIGTEAQLTNPEMNKE